VTLRPDFKKLRAARRNYYLREADEIPQMRQRRDAFPWKPFEIVLGPNPARQRQPGAPPAELPIDEDDE
jgi:hypothetical protein